jgi:hypothetical protein
MILHIIVWFSIYLVLEFKILSLAATQFHHFFSSPEMMPITENFTIYHIDAPGQEDRANPLPTT